MRTITGFRRACDRWVEAAWMRPTDSIHFLTDLILERRQLVRRHLGKEVGPDGVSPRVLKTCAPQLCGVFHHVFSMNLSLQRFPVMWRTSCLVRTCGTDPLHQDPGETCLGTAPALGQTILGPHAVCLSAPMWSCRWCHCLPAQPC